MHEFVDSTLIAGVQELVDEESLNNLIENHHLGANPATAPAHLVIGRWALLTVADKLSKEQLIFAIKAEKISPALVLLKTNV